MAFNALSKRLSVAATALAMTLAGVASANGDDQSKGPLTASPVKHVVIIMGENRTFDHVFGLYTPRPGETVSNLLSKGIVKQDGTPGPLFFTTRQYTAPVQTSYFVSADHKTPYGILPAPQLLGTPYVQTSLATFSPANPFPPYTQSLLAYIQSSIPIPLEPGIPASDLALLTTGATGLATTAGADTRVTNASSLPNGVFQLTGATMPYDAYTGDPTHRFYQNWQQSDCSVKYATMSNPTGCLHDLYPYVMSTASTTSEGGTSMAFLNMQKGDAPYLKSLADQYTMSDNYHQAQMGGTMVEHFYLGMADNLYFSDGNGNAITPPSSMIANPNPQPGTQNQYINDSVYTNCSDIKQPGVAPIANYLLHSIIVRSLIASRATTTC